MFRSQRDTATILVAMLSMLVTSQAIARGVDDPPTVGFTIDYGPTTYKSELVQSNDTSLSMRYSLAIFAGETRSIVFMLKNDSNATTFALNESTVEATWQETQLKYRWNSLYFGVVLATLNMTASAAGTSLFELTGTGFGANVGGSFAIGRSGAFYFDVSAATISQIAEINQTDISFGSRTDIDLGTSYALSKRMFDAVFGYRQRTLPVTLGTSANEVLTTTYFGISASLDF
jgi:predicted porin